ncbi:dTMP kinase [Reinekea sp.]|jgi:dTMP kinase|uniref:dTMP kinase n=1 Tax=Reinekea sp. TaxID=1970455 RepID=UPI003988F5C8
MTGKFITIEGLEGVGKSTQANNLAQWIKTKGHTIVRTREPGGTPIAEAIRDVVLDMHPEKMDPTTELLLVFAARKQHTESLIRPSLTKGAWVLSDRYTDATYAYQGGGRKLDLATISHLENLVLKGFKPDLTIWLDCDAEIGLARAKARGALDRIEVEDIGFFNQCRAAYQQRFEADPMRFIRLDANQSIEAVKADLVQALEGWYDTNS